jgi:hypothetical protein
MPLSIYGANADININGNFSDIGGKQKNEVKGLEGSDNNNIVRNTTTTTNTRIADLNNNNSVEQSIGQNLC